MTGIQHRRRTGLALGTAAGLALAGSAICATPAAAHTPTWSVDCSSVTVDLTRYDGNVTNTVTVTAGGKDLLATQEFGTEFHKRLTLPDHAQPLDVRLIVKAGDSDRFSRDETKSSPVCEESESPEPTPSETAPQSPSPTPSQTASSSAPAEEPAGSSTPIPDEDLAETGSSDSTPVIAGIAAAVVAAGAGLLVVARKRRSTRA